MSLIQKIQNGQVVNNDKSKTANSSKVTTSKGEVKSASETKDMFLKLLVTEMQYQDPMEPTDNSEYVKEMATFSQVESLQNMQDTMENMGATNYVGKVVEVTDEDGKTHEGPVDYVTEEDGVKKVSIDGKLYDASKVTSIVDYDYYKNNYMLNSFEELYAKLPSMDKLTVNDEKQVTEIANLYNSMSDDLKKTIDEKKVANVQALYNRVQALVKAKQEGTTVDSLDEGEEPKAEEKTDETGKTDETLKTEETNTDVKSENGANETGEDSDKK